MVPTTVSWPAFLDGRPKGLLVDGESVEARSGRTFDTINPATGELLATVADASADDVDRAVTAARRAFDGEWSRWTPYDRQRAVVRLADLVEAHFDELSLLDTLDMGAPWTRTRLSRRAVSLLHWYAAQAVTLTGDTIPNSLPGEILSYTLREPVGVVGGIIPWNGPIPATIWKLGPVLATGCTLVLKPAEEAPLSPLRLGELCVEAGIPPGVVNVVPGGAEAGAALAAHPDVDKVAFTGSVATGQAIVRASAGNLKRLTLELGGKSPDIVFADADLDAAVPGAGMAIFGNAGQVCSAGSRLFVERPIYDEFVARVADFGAGLKVGNGVEPDTQMGPVVSAAQLDRVLGSIAAGRQEGAEAVTGGSRLVDGDLAAGFFVAPTVLTGVGDDTRVVREEIFGPVLVALPFDSLDEVAHRANATPFGLGAGVWTTDVRRAHHLSRRLRAGSVWINTYQAMDPAVPFGGYRQSGYGRESGRDQLDEYLNVKAVWINAG
jgi:aldehyde dehydrogenase (NAD+)